MPRELVSQESLRPYFILPRPANKDWMKAKTATYYNATGWRGTEYNWITEQIVLGDLPSIEQIKKIKKEAEAKGLEVGAIFCLVESFELAISDATPEKCFQENIKHYWLPIKDETANVTIENMARFVRTLRECVKSGKVSIVHCLSGMGRSFMVLASYLALYGDGNKLEKGQRIADVQEYVQRNKRKQVNLNAHQLKFGNKAVMEISESGNQHAVHERRPLKREKASDLKTAVVDVLTSLEFRNDIVEFVSFKQLGILAFSTDGYMSDSQTSLEIRTMLEEIYFATDETWFIKLLARTQPSDADYIANNDTLAIQEKDADGDVKELCNQFLNVGGEDKSIFRLFSFFSQSHAKNSDNDYQARLNRFATDICTYLKKQLGINFKTLMSMMIGPEITPELKMPAVNTAPVHSIKRSVC